MPVQQAAQFFFYVTVAGVIGKVAFSFMAPWLGRRRCGRLEVGVVVGVPPGTGVLRCCGEWAGHPRVPLLRRVRDPPQGSIRRSRTRVNKTVR